MPIISALITRTCVELTLTRAFILKSWEIAALLALAVVLLWGTWTAHSQDTLARKMIRLHVIANSDSEQDQTLKLQVRDKVLAKATEILEASDNMRQAAQKLEQSLPDMEAIAVEEISARGYDYPVTACLEETEFPTKDYDGFRLPSGEYLALRIVIGEGAGKNWWCVVFPPLCFCSVAEPVPDGTDGERIILKSRIYEWLRERNWPRQAKVG